MLYSVFITFCLSVWVLIERKRLCNYSGLCGCAEEGTCINRWARWCEWLSFKTLWAWTWARVSQWDWKKKKKKRERDVNVVLARIQLLKCFSYWTRPHQSCAVQSCWTRCERDSGYVQLSCLISSSAQKRCMEPYQHFIMLYNTILREEEKMILHCWDEV